MYDIHSTNARNKQPSTMHFQTAALLILLLLSHTFSDATQASDGPSNQPKDKVVLVHGLGRSEKAMWLLAVRLEKQGFDVHRIDYDSIRRSPDEILNDVNEQISACCLGAAAEGRREKDAHKIHFVGHSLGGLVIRAYLQEQPPERLGKVVLIGTPNGGSPLVDKYGERWWARFFGPTTNALGTDETAFPSKLGDPDYPLGIIAGITPLSPFSKDLPGDDDGLVEVDATRVDGMQDFIILKASHGYMRYSPQVMRQVAAFLKAGKFDHDYTPPKPKR